MGILLIILQVIEYKYSIRDIPTSILILFLALIFTSIGIWVGLNFRTQKKTGSLVDEQDKIQKRLSLLKISSREYDVLQLIGQGFFKPANSRSATYFLEYSKDPHL